MIKYFLVLFFLLISLPAISEEPEQKIQGFNLQGYGEGGNKTWDVNGETANIDGSQVSLSNVSANSYGDQKVNVTAQTGKINQATGEMNLNKDVVITGEQGAQMMTDSLNWDRTNDLVTTDDSVILTDKDLTVTGKGFEAKPGLKNAKIKEDVAVTVKTNSKQNNDESKVTITSDGPMSIDQSKSMAVFEENVVAIQGDRILKADRMEIYFDPKKNTLSQIICIGNVEVVQGENQTFAQKAVYMANEQRLVLSGRPKLIMLTEGQNGFSAFGN